MLENVTSGVLLLLVVLMVREVRVARSAVASDPSISAGRAERFRTLRLQYLEVGFAVVVTGSLLLTDLERAPSHGAAAIIGGVAGYAFGTYRARTTYVSAVPEHRGVVLRSSVEAVVSLGLLLGIKLVAENDLLPDAGVFRLVVAGLLAFLLVEAFARVFTLRRCYDRDATASASPEQR